MPRFEIEILEDATVRLTIRDADGHVVDIMDQAAPGRWLLNGLIARLMGNKYAVRKVRK